MVETTDKFAIMKNLDEIDAFSKYMHNTYDIQLEKKLELIQKTLQGKIKRNIIDIIDTILEYSFFLIKKETTENEENYLSFITNLSPNSKELYEEIIMYCHTIPHFKESLQQHLIISALYTIKELCANKMNAKRYLLDLYDKRNTSDNPTGDNHKYLSNDGPYRFINEQLGSWERMFVNLTSSPVRGGSQKMISDFLPLYLYGYWKKNDIAYNITYKKPLRLFRTNKNYYNNKRDFDRYLCQLDKTYYSLIDLGNCESSIDELLYYYKLERAYGVDLLKEFLIQMDFDNTMILREMTGRLHARDIAIDNDKPLEKLRLIELLKKNVKIETPLTRNDILAFFDNVSSEIEDNSTITVIDHYNVLDDFHVSYKNHFKNTTFDTNFLIKAQQLPNVFSRNYFISHYFDDTASSDFETLLYKVLPLMEFTFFSLINMLWNKNKTIEGLKIIDDYLTKYVQKRMASLLISPYNKDNFEFIDIWFSSLIKIKKAKIRAAKINNSLYDNNSLYTLYNNQLLNNSVFKEQFRRLNIMHNRALIKYFQKRYDSSWWTYDYQSQIRSDWNK